MKVFKLGLAILLTFFVLQGRAEKIDQKKLYDMLIKHNIKYPDKVVRIAVLETGHFKSRRAIKDHNIFSLTRNYKIGKRWITRYEKYKSYNACIKDYKYRVQNKLRNNENYYTFLNRIKYAADKRYVYKLKKIKLHIV